MCRDLIMDRDPVVYGDPTVNRGPTVYRMCVMYRVCVVWLWAPYPANLLAYVRHFMKMFNECLTLIATALSK